MQLQQFEDAIVLGDHSRHLRPSHPHRPPAVSEAIGMARSKRPPARCAFGLVDDRAGRLMVRFKESENQQRRMVHPRPPSAPIPNGVWVNSAKPGELALRDGKQSQTLPKVCDR